METGLFRAISSSSIRNFLPRSISSKQKSSSNPKNPKSTPNDENTVPTDPNIPLSYGPSSPTVHRLSYGPSSPTVHRQSPSDFLKFHPEMARSDGKKQASVPPDPPVKVVLRIRPAIDGQKDGDQTVKKVSIDTVSVEDRSFTFDSVLDSKSKQVDIFRTVGVPLVKSALAGYNTSILSYGQSGSGKTYTMWGPPSAMVEDPSPASQQGIVPRICQMLFSEIENEKVNSEGKQINYQCRCSFLEIYNEEIGDLIDPTQRNLKIKDEAKNGLYVENLTEEYVTSYEDVMQILIKGLSSRKVGATSVNSKSSRSHIVFTFIIESWCKGTSSKCFGSSRTSRISLVDLAGLDQSKVIDEGGQSLRTVKNVKKSLSRLGHLVNVLSKGSYSGKPEDVLYRSSCLTHLLKESLGGNSKLTVICTIVPDNSNNGEVLRTLRFGERVKSIRNEPVINEITEDDVNDLSDQIRLLKEELIRAKSSTSSDDSRNGYFQGCNVRESLNQLRVTLNRSLLLPHMDNDSDEEMVIDEDDVRELHEQLDELHNSYEEKPRDPSGPSLNRDSMKLGESCGQDFVSEDDIFPEETEIEETNFGTSENELPHKEETIALTDDISCSSNTFRAINSEFGRSISISSSCKFPILQEPTMSESPKFGKNQRKSIAFSLSYGVCQSNVSDNAKIESDELRPSLRQSSCIRSSLQSSKKLAGPTESLAASLQRGLKIIDCHQQNSASNKSPLAFSFEHLMLKSCPEYDEVKNDSNKTFLCASCRQCVQEKDAGDVQVSNQMKEDTCSSMDEVTKREELEKRCTKQALHIEELNKLIERLKREKHNSKEQINVPCLSSKNENYEIVLFEDPKDAEKFSRCGSVDNHQQEVIKDNYEIKEIQNESVHGYGSTFFDVNEKEALLKEIQMLRCKLKSQTNASINMSTEKLRSSLLSRSIQLQKSGAYHEEELEKERQRWTEIESEWISLTDELRIDIDTHRQRAEQLEMELKLEKKRTEELDDALVRAVLGHARFVEHYVELQEKYNDLVEKHQSMMGVITEVRRAALKAGKKGQGSRFAKVLTAELSAERVKRERERDILKKENKSLKIQLRDTAEAVHAAGELLVRLREAENTASTAEENFVKMHEDNEKLKKQMEKLKRKHKMEMITMKQYIAESKLPESALQQPPLYREDSDVAQNTFPDDDQAWRAEFGAIYQQHY